jgi:signal transduction histidine kinase
VKRGSLRIRLLLGAAVAIFAALAASWVAMTWLFERHVERRVEADLIREGKELAARVAVGTDGAPTLSEQPGDRRYAQAASGLYWQVSTPRGTLRSRSLWDQVLPASPSAPSHRWSKRFEKGPFEDEVLVVERVVHLSEGDAGVLLQLAHESQTVQLARSEFGAELAVFLLLLWLILAAAAWVQVELGLRPLRQIRASLQSLQHDPSRRLDASQVSEIEPLTRAINDLADAREQDLARARRRAGDLAHGLKTPLAALSAQSRRARDAGAAAAAEGLDRAIAAATAAVEGELARTRAAAIRGSGTAVACAPLPLIESVVGVVERTEFGAQLVFEVDVADSLRVPVAREDFLELIGALLENAARYARRYVRIRGPGADGVALNIEDDGPGIASAQAAEAIMRGGRLDEAEPGHGLGLSIAHDLVVATGGTLTLLRSDLGGLRVDLSWSS